MTQHEVSKPSKVFEHFDGQKFTVRGTRKRFGFGEKGRSRESIDSNISNEFYLKTDPNRMGMGSVSSKASIALRGSQRRSVINFKTTLLAEQSALSLTTTYWGQEHWAKPRKLFNDDFDISEHPSYSIKNVA